MKRFFRIVLAAVLITVMLLPSVSAAGEQKTHKYDNYINYRDPLANTYRKLTEDKKLKVVYFGGSVTAGYGSTNAGLYSWQSLSSAWLENKFPEADISVVNTAIDESGTFLGTYRVQKDVIAQNPDLLFIEYAINDKYKNSTKEQAALQYETIVREVRTALPECDIVTLLVIDQSTSKLLPDLYPTAAGHEMIAEAYNIPTVNVGASLVDSMSDPEKEWSTYFIDIVHPTDAGYKKYYDCLEEFLHNSLICEELSSAPTGHTMPKIQSDHLLDGNRMSLIGIKMRPYLVSSKGFTYVDELYYGPVSTPHIGYYTCPKGTTDAEITFRFNGTEFSIWTNFYNNSAVDISIDGGSVKRVMCDSHAPSTLVKELAPGEHYITLKPVVFGDGADAMKIGAVFFRDDTKQSGNAVDPATREPSSGNTTVSSNHSHEYGDWFSDSDVHWKECSCGDVTNWSYHTFTKWVKTDGEAYNRTCSVCGYSQNDAVNTECVFLSSSGSDSNSGTTADKPLKTLKAAVNKVNELGLHGDSRVISVIKCDWNGLSFDMSGCTPYDEMITLKAQTALTVWSTSDMYLAGPFTLEVDYGNSVTQQGMSIYTCGYDFTLDAKDQKGNSNIYAGYNTGLGLSPDEMSGNIEWNKNMYLRITGEREITLGKIVVGNSNYTDTNVVYGVADILIDNPKLTVSSLKLGSSGNFANTGTQSNRFSGINLTVNNVKEITSLEGATYYNAVYVKNLQLLFNNGTFDRITDKLVYGYYGNTNIQFGNKWTVINRTAGENIYLNATNEAGVFTVTGGRKAVLTSDTGGASYTSENGNIKVPFGSYSMTVGDAESYTFTDGLLTAVKDLHGFNAAEIVPSHMDGGILIGIKNEKGEYPRNTTALELKAGEKLYAVYTDSVMSGSNAVFRVSGAEKRSERKTAIRFILEKSGGFDTVFKPFESVKYGYIVLPEHYVRLGEAIAVENGNAAIGSTDDADFVYYDKKERFTVCITDIPEKHYGESFSACGFVTYNDLNGNRRTVYTDTACSSLFEVTANSRADESASDGDSAYDTELINKTLFDKKAALNSVISSAADTVTAAAGGNTYYVSEKGNDSNDGLSKERPIRSLTRLSTLSLKSGDAVLFERGGSYRTASKYSDGTSLRLRDGVSYGAYGSGYKPIINGSFENYAERSWSRYSQNGNIWYTDISNVSADPGVLRVTLKNGYQYTGCVKESVSDLNSEWQFCQVGTVIYMYCQYGAPTNLLGYIEIGYGFDMFKIDNVGNITIENLAFTCGGRHAIGGTNGANNVTVRGCEFSYIGGSVMQNSDGTRLGNAVEFLGDCSDILVERCKFVNIYDSGVTFQGTSAKVSGFTVRDNVFEKCGLASFEYWIGIGGYAKKIIIENNYMSDVGGGFGGIGKRTLAASKVAHIRADGVNKVSDFIIRDNFLDSAADGAYLAALCCQTDSGGAFPALLHNTYIQESDGDFLVIRTAASDSEVLFKANAAGCNYLRQSFDGRAIVILK